MKLIFAASILLTSTWTWTLAGETTFNAQVRVYRANAAPSVIELDQQTSQITVRSKTPHRQLNPDRKTAEFEGVVVRSLLRLTPKNKNLLVHFVGTDGYISSVPASVLLKTDAILALRESGQPIDKHRGGLQVIYPTEGTNAVDDAYAKKAAFWCWYVHSIVVGDLPNHLTISTTSIQALKKEAKAFSFVPPSVFQIKKAECPKTFRIPLSRITKAQTVSLSSLSGKSKQVPSANYDLIFTGQGTALPVICGGPFALVDHAQAAARTSPFLAKELEANIISIEERK